LLVPAKEVAVVIPARYRSERLPGKPLVPVAGKPLIRRVWESLAEEWKGKILVATDDERVLDVVQAFGGEAFLTSANHKSGTERVAEASKNLPAGIVVNVQGDELFVGAAMIREITEPFGKDASLKMASLRRPLESTEDLLNPNVVKVVIDSQSRALYFSRRALPYVRGEADGVPRDISNSSIFHRHVGLYAYRSDFLQELASWPETFLERDERLEQLRALERGVRIHCAETSGKPFGVDTEEDVKEAERRVRENP
jgi:3-deoxy-manno-octulosonate cytidylyltransferase (CMP-KDO synthetase)